MDNDELNFLDEEDHDVPSTQPAWKGLIVDDDKEVHSFTKLALHDFSYLERPIDFISAYSGAEARAILEKEDDVAIVLLDIVMESSDAGLQLVEFIRYRLEDDLIRIIIRTGQPGEAPERFVIEHYDINDYKEKTELTRDRLFSTVRTALAQYRQLIELVNKKNALYRMLITDALTQLPNRIKLNDDLDKSNNVSLLLIDIDAFSVLNDTYGFVVGDEILISVSHLLQGILQPGQILYHLEADLFAILVDDISTDDIVEKVRRTVAKHHFHIGEIVLRISCSLGIVNDEKGNIIQKAEIALREARKISRNRIQVYSKSLEMNETVRLNSQWTKRISDAIDSDNILIYAQPILNSGTLEVEKYECLVRLRHDDVIYSPADFLETARYAGLLHTITGIVFSKACELFENNEMQFSINITDIDVIDTEFIPFCERVRREHNISSSRITFEILEEASVMQLSTAQEFFHRLIELGYQISIDDFGTKCSNFAQLGELPLDSIKIDGSFIKDIDSNPSSLTIVESILFFCKRKGVKTVAEFVHSEAIYTILKEMGVDYLQGYYFGEPKATL